MLGTTPPTLIYREKRSDMRFPIQIFWTPRGSINNLFSLHAFKIDMFVSCCIWVFASSLETFLSVSMLCVCVCCMLSQGPWLNEAGVGGSFATPCWSCFDKYDEQNRTGKEKSNFCSSVLAPLCCMTRVPGGGLAEVLAAAALRYYFAGVLYRGCTAELRTPSCTGALPSARRVEFAYWDIERRWISGHI